MLGVVGLNCCTGGRVSPWLPASTRVALARPESCKFVFMVSVVPRLDECPTRAELLLDASDCLVGTAARLVPGCCQSLIVGVLAVQALRQETASAAAKAAGASRFRSPDIQCHRS